MALSREEIAADLAWRYVEHVRAAEAEPLTDEELEQLVAVLKSVAPTGEALTDAEVEERRTAVRRRLEALQPPAAAPARAFGYAARPRTSVPSPVVPAWRFRVACAFTAALALLLGTVGFWHKAPIVVRRLVIPRDIRGVEAMDEKQAHRMLPEMVSNHLSPQQEKDLMAHMLVCPGCFNAYQQMKPHQQSAEAGVLMLASGEAEIPTLPAYPGRRDRVTP
jgi:hypothetical protein